MLNVQTNNSGKANGTTWRDVPGEWRFLGKGSHQDAANISKKVQIDWRRVFMAKVISTTLHGFAVQQTLHGEVLHEWAHTQQ